MAQVHRVDPLLFAMRSVPNSSGYTPFEFMFGRRCRTHMSILKELWTGQNHEPEVKTTYQYVLDLRQRIEETCKLAQDELIKTQGKNKKYFNKKAKLRVLEKGEKVLVLLPTASNKLLFQWKGPAEVTERRGLVNYRVKFESGEEKTFHINMLKRYNEREDPSRRPEGAAVERDGEISDIEESNIEVKGEETIMGVIIESDDESEQTQNSAGRSEADTVAAMGVVVDSDSEDEEYQERTEDSSARCYNIEQKETWKDVDVNPELSRDQSCRVWRLIEEYKDIFSDVPTTTHILEHDSKLTSEEPVYSKYKLPYNLVEPISYTNNLYSFGGWGV